MRSWAERRIAAGGRLVAAALLLLVALAAAAQAQTAAEADAERAKQLGRDGDARRTAGQRPGDLDRGAGDAARGARHPTSRCARRREGAPAAGRRAQQADRGARAAARRRRRGGARGRRAAPRPERAARRGAGAAPDGAGGLPPHRHADRHHRPDGAHPLLGRADEPRAEPAAAGDLGGRARGARRPRPRLSPWPARPVRRAPDRARRHCGGFRSSSCSSPPASGSRSWCGSGWRTGWRDGSPTIRRGGRRRCSWRCATSTASSCRRSGPGCSSPPSIAPACSPAPTPGGSSRCRRSCSS